MADDFLKTDPELDDQELIVASKRAINYLQAQRNYRYVEFLAQGGYGWVSLVYDDSEKCPLAIKCTIDTSDMELSWWPKLQHDTILPLIEYITLDSCTVFIMPAMRKDLWMCVTEPRFYQDELSFGLCRIWLGDVATALDYMHKQNLCHLDLKLDNVFLKDNGRVCLGDFSLLSDSREVPAKFHFLELYEPPEYTDWCHGTPPSGIADADQFGGDKADMWQYGILALDLLTNLSLSGERSNYFTLWHHDVWPFVQKVLQHKEYLEYLMEDAFQNVFFNELDFDLCHEFLEQILIIEPNVRASAADAMRHEFVNVDWPQIPTSFGMPNQVKAHVSKPRGKEMEKKPSDEGEDETKGTRPLEESTSQTADVLKQKMEKLQKEKQARRESLAAIAGKSSLMIRHNMSDMDVEDDRSPSQDLNMSDVDVQDNVVIKKSVEVNNKNNNGNRNRSTKKISIAPHRKLEAKVSKDPTKSTASQLGRSSKSSTQQVTRFLTSSSKNVRGKSPVKKRSESKSKSSKSSRSPTGKISPTAKKSSDGKKSPSTLKKSPRDEKSESNRTKNKPPVSRKSSTGPKGKTSSDDQKKTARVKSPTAKKSIDRKKTPSTSKKSPKNENSKSNPRKSKSPASKKSPTSPKGKGSPDDQKKTAGVKSSNTRKSEISANNKASSDKDANPKKSISSDQQDSHKASSHELSHQNSNATKDKKKTTNWH